VSIECKTIFSKDFKVAEYMNTKTQKKLDYQIYQSVVYADREQNSVDAKIKEEIKKAETKRKRNAN
jgi:hypothetical protein